MSTARAAVFLDRDGVLNELMADPESGFPESPLRRDDVRLLPGAADALIALRQAGYATVCVTNQPAAAKGKTSVGELEAIQRRVADLLASEGAVVDAWRLCLHHPDGVVAALSGSCTCRKPAPGMLLDAARELELDLACSWMVGDADTDVLAGTAAGCRTVLVEYPPSAHRRLGGVVPDLDARDLREGAERLLALRSTC